MGNTIEVVLTIIGLSFWILFPIGMFLSVSHIDKNTDQLIRLEELRHKSVDSQKPYNDKREEVYQPIPFDWHHPVHFFRQWLEH